MYLQRKLHINVEVLSRWDVDIIDCAIFAYIERICYSPAKKVVRQRDIEGRSWVDIETLVKSIPPLKLKYDTVQRRISRMARIGLLDKNTLQSGSKRRLYIKPTDDYYQKAADLELKHQKEAWKWLEAEKGGKGVA